MYSGSVSGVVNDTGVSHPSNAVYVRGGSPAGAVGGIANLRAGQDCQWVERGGGRGWQCHCTVISHARAGRIDLLPVPFSGMSCCRQASRAFTVVAFICIVTHLVSLALMYFRRVQGKVSSDDNLWDPEAPTRSLRLATESVDEEASFT